MAPAAFRTAEDSLVPSDVAIPCAIWLHRATDAARMAMMKITARQAIPAPGIMLHPFAR